CGVAPSEGNLETKASGQPLGRVESRMPAGSRANPEGPEWEQEPLGGLRDFQSAFTLAFDGIAPPPAGARLLNGFGFQLAHSFAPQEQARVGRAVAPVWQERLEWLTPVDWASGQAVSWNVSPLPFGGAIDGSSIVG